MAVPYEYNPNRAPHAESTFTTPAPPNYATFAGGYPPQQPPEYDGRGAGDGEADPADTHIPVDRMNVRSS